MKPALTALCFALAAPAADAQGAAVPPKSLTLIPAPDANGKVRGIDGREFTVNAAKVVAAFKTKRPIDENHSTHVAAPNGLPSPAFGWVNALREVDGAVVGELSWNKRGTESYGEYGFVSPALDHDKDGNVLRLVSVGLTNDPNFPQLALNRAGSPSPEAEEAPPMSKAIALALGLAETAPEAEIVTAINSVKSKAATPDITQFVPRSDYQLALNRATTAEAALADGKKAEHDAAVETAINGALTAGKITPASVDYHRAMCAQQGGLDKFKAYVAAAPAVIAQGVDPATQKTGDSLSLNATDRAVARQLGMSDETYLASKKQVAADLAAATAAAAV